MTLTQLERRVKKLEKTVEELRTVPNTSAKSWLDSAGRFANDPVFEEIVRLGRQYRESLRPGKARKKRASNGRVRH